MTDQQLAGGMGPDACPFVALVDDRDRRVAQPDPRHRCFAEIQPSPRAPAHQAHYCLGAAFAACPTFQDWARRESARVVAPAATGMPQATMAPGGGAAGMTGVTGPAGTVGADVPRRLEFEAAVGRPAEPPRPPAEAPRPPATADLGPPVLWGAEEPAGFSAEPAAGEPPQPAAGPRLAADPRLAVGEPPHPAAPARRLRPDDAGWSDQIDIRRNLPPSGPSEDRDRDVRRFRPVPDDQAPPGGAGRRPDARPPAGAWPPTATWPPADARRAAELPGPATPPRGAQLDDSGSGPAPQPAIGGSRAETAPFDPDAAANELAAYLARRAAAQDPRRAARNAPSAGDALAPRPVPGPNGTPVSRGYRSGDAGAPAGGPGESRDFSAPEPRPATEPRPSVRSWLRPGQRPTAGTAAGVSQAHPAVAGSRARATREASAPPWEPPRHMEAYPRLRTRVGLPSVPRIAIAGIAVVLAAAVLFVLPGFLTSEKPSPSPTASRAVASSSASVSQPPPTAPATSGSTAIVYTVVSGDTLTRIAKKYGVSVQAIMDANPQITSADQIKIGDQITIPPKSTPASSGSAKPPSTPKPSASP